MVKLNKKDQMNTKLQLLAILSEILWKILLGHL